MASQVADMKKYFIHREFVVIASSECFLILDQSILRHIRESTRWLTKNY